jgi:hypothetical protein
MYRTLLKVMVPKMSGSQDLIKTEKNFPNILGGKGLDEVEKMIPTKDGGALLGIYSRSSRRDSGRNPERKESTANNHPNKAATSVKAITGSSN